MAQQKNILFHVALPHQFVYFKPVYDMLHSDPRIVVWCSVNAFGWDFHLSLNDMFGVPKSHTINSIKAMTKHYDLSIFPFYPKVNLGRRSELKLQIFHGVAITNCFLKPKIREFDKCFMVGPYMVRRFVEKGYLPPEDGRIEMVGMPKVDCLIDGTLSRERIAGEIGLNPKLPTVLYAPSGTYSSLARDGMDIIRHLHAMPINLLVKLHDKSRDRRRNTRNWKNWVRKWERGHTYFLEGYDIAPYLFVSEILISDFSSAANEFLLMDRPIIFLDTPEKFERTRDRWDSDVWGQRVGARVKTMAELDKAMDDAISEPMRMSEIRRAAAQDIFYKPGSATQRAVQRIYRYLQLNPMIE